MRLPVDAGFRFFVLGLTSTALAGCGLVGGGDRPAAITDASLSFDDRGTGPSADYPIVLGEPFTVDGELHTPADTLNYDVVGYATLDGGRGVTIAHRTLPLPSYVEVTSLASGKTILARVERRGPMTGAPLIALSSAAAAQLGAGDGEPIRVRRVNPPERDRLALRSGNPASERMATPRSLVDVLRRKLPVAGSASLRASVPPRSAADAQTSPKNLYGESAQVGADGPPETPKAATAFPLKPLPSATPVAVATPEVTPVTFRIGQDRNRSSSVLTARPAPAATPSDEGFVVQAGTFSVEANAKRVAEAIGGYISPAGKFFRVRTGPFTSRGQADAALAKVRAAGYSDARVYTEG